MERAELIIRLLNTEVRSPVRRREIYIDDDAEEQTARFITVVRDTHPIDFPKHPGEFVLKKHEKDPFAPLSPYYINLRNLPENLVSDIALELTKLKFPTTPDCVAGIPNGAVPFARKYSQITGIPYENFLKKEKLGGKRSIMSYNELLAKPKKLLIIEDVITVAHSCREAIRVSEYLGYSIVGIASFFDREEGGVQTLRDLGLQVEPVLKLTETMKYCKELGRITNKLYSEIIRYKNTEFLSSSDLK